MSALIQSVNTDNFESKILRAPAATLVDFWAEWCAPCRAQNPVLEELAGEWEGKVRIAKVNVDDDPELASRYNIMSIPTMILFRDGRAVRQVTGVQSAAQLRALLAASNLN
ncbi:MAG: thioredoxin [Candidatus Omnitrophica bacterium]|nr:thioredoxin [Candidatus Omnitrophota bacterium]